MFNHYVQPIGLKICQIRWENTK